MAGAPLVLGGDVMVTAADCYLRTRRRAQRAGMTVQQWDALPRRRRIWLWWVTL